MPSGTWLRDPKSQWRRLIDRIFHTKNVAPAARRNRRARLQVLGLEDRITPSHFRYGTLNWEAVSGPGIPANTVEFHMQQAWRLTYPWTNALTNVSYPDTGNTLGNNPKAGDILSGAGTFVYGD